MHVARRGATPRGQHRGAPLSDQKQIPGSAKKNKRRCLLSAVKGVMQGPWWLVRWRVSLTHMVRDAWQSDVNASQSATLYGALSRLRNRLIGTAASVFRQFLVTV